MIRRPTTWLGIGKRIRADVPRDAAKIFAAAVRFRPDYAAAILNLATVHQQYLHDNKAALENYRTYLALNPHPANWDEVNAIAMDLEKIGNESGGSAAGQTNPARRRCRPNRHPEIRCRIRQQRIPFMSIRRRPATARITPTVSHPVERTDLFSAAGRAGAERAGGTGIAHRGPAPNESNGQGHHFRDSAGSATSGSAHAAANGKTRFLASPFRRLAEAHAGQFKISRQRTDAVAARGRFSDGAAHDQNLGIAAGQTSGGGAGFCALQLLLAAQTRAGRSHGGFARSGGIHESAAGGDGGEMDGSTGMGIKQAATLDPSWFEAQYNTGVMAHRLHNYALALPRYEAALAIQPDSVDARYNFALALKAGGYPLDAANELKKILAANPSETRAHLALANICAQSLRDMDEARMHYQKVLELDPKCPQASDIRFWLSANQK